MIDSIDSEIEKIINDGVYDSRAIFNYLDKLNIQPVIRVRDNSIAKSRGSLTRKKTVIAYRKDSDKWKESNSYGQRW